MTDQRPASTSESCFVIQPFGGLFDKIYENVYRPAIQHVGLKPLRGDSSHAPSDIMDYVWRNIKEASVLVCDLSNLRPNVIYELGLAHASGKPVILVMREGQELPFDIQSIRTIFFELEDPLWGTIVQNRVAEALKAAISDPVNSTPPMFRNVKPSELPAQDELRAEMDEIKLRLQNIEMSSRPTPRGLFAFGERVHSGEAGYRRRSIKCFVTLNGALIPPGFETFEGAKSLADEHIAADPNADVAIDIYYGEDGNNLVETFRKNAESGEWMKWQ